MAEIQALTDLLKTLGPFGVAVAVIFASQRGWFKWPREGEYYTKREYDALKADKEKVEANHDRLMTIIEQGVE